MKCDFCQQEHEDYRYWEVTPLDDEGHPDHVDIKYHICNPCLLNGLFRYKKRIERIPTYRCPVCTNLTADITRSVKCNICSWPLSDVYLLPKKEWKINDQVQERDEQI